MAGDYTFYVDTNTGTSSGSTFTISGGSDSNLLFTDASTNSISIGTTTPVTYWNYDYGQSEDKQKIIDRKEKTIKRKQSEIDDLKKSKSKVRKNLRKTQKENKKVKEENELLRKTVQSLLELHYGNGRD